MRLAALFIAVPLVACGGRREPPPPVAVPSAAAELVPAVIETDHVRLHTTLPDGELRLRLPVVLEQAVRSFIDLAGGGSEPVIEVHFFTTEAEWRDAVQEQARRRLGRELPLGSGLRRAGVTIDGSAFLFDIGGDDALRLAAHEAWHAYAHHAFDHALPLWLDEALACRAEGFYWAPDATEPILRASANPSRREHVRRMVDAGRLGTLEAHLRADPASLTHDSRGLDDYYARAWVLGLTLEDPQLTDRLRLALARAVRGTLPEGEDDAVASVLGMAAVELEARWRHAGLTLAEE